MRKILYIIILALLFLTPVKRLDIAKLEPVQTVALYTDDAEIILETDTDNKGRGATVAQAYEDLESRTPGVIYLDTAQYLLVTQDAMPFVDTLGRYLCQSVKVSLWDGSSSISAAAKYLNVQKNLPDLRQWQQEIKNIEKSKNKS